jgi:glycine/D-amino acid oxidase-like deaminating enzyme
MSISYWLDQGAGRSIETDVLIVGAGITGLSLAYWVNQEDPNLKVTIVERGRVGSGATGRNAGFITCGSVEHFNRLVERWGDDKALEMWRFSEKNLDLLREHIIEDADAIEFRHDGTFSLASTNEEFHELKKTADLMRRFDIAVDVLNENEIKNRLGVVNFVGGIKYLKDASVDPIKLLGQMERKIKAQILPYSEVFDLKTESDGTVIARTNTTEIRSSVVMLALNGYSSQLKPYFKDKIYPTRGQIMITNPVEPFMEGACYANFVLDYFRQLRNGQVLIGGFRQLEKATEVGYSDHTTDVIQDALYEFLQTYIPRLKDTGITHRWSGVMGFSSDGQPLIGALPDEPQIYFSGGYTGHGLGLAFHSAKCLVDLVFGREIPDFINAKRF